MTGTTIREWARSQGLEVADKGLLPRHIIDAYKQAHGIGPASLASEEPWLDKTPEPTEQDFGPVFERFELEVPPMERPLSEWLEMRNELTQIITAQPTSIDAAERILLDGWTRG